MIRGLPRDFKLQFPITLGIPLDWTIANIAITEIEPGSRCRGEGLIVGAYNWGAIYLRRFSIGKHDLLSKDGEVDGMLYSTAPNLQMDITNGLVLSIEFRYTGYIPQGLFGGAEVLFTSVYRTTILSLEA